MKTWLLALLSAGILFMFFSLEKNELWWQNRIRPYMKNFRTEVKSLDLETRQMQRYGLHYKVIKYLEKQVPEGSTLLLPPQSYFLDKIYSIQKPNEIRYSYIDLAKCNLVSYHSDRFIPVHMESPDSILQSADYSFIVDESKNFMVLDLQEGGNREYVLKAFEPYVDYPARNLNPKQILSRLKELN